MGDRHRNDTPESREAMLSALGRAYALALISGDEVAAEHAIRDAMDAGLSTVEIDDEIIAPALWLIGEKWEKGEISVADEHLATEISLRVLALQREAQRLKRGRHDHRVMLAAVTGEQHIVALRMVANLLRAAGYDVVMLGADVPPEALAASARRHEPHAICLSSTMPGGGDQLLIAIHEVQREWPGTGFVVGGRGLASRLRSQPGIDVCDSVGDAVEAVDAIVKRASLN
jgi:MerR family transcriptional regulator, light-induced transcriptional regulator